jgi:hypothetical protein
MFFPFSKNSKKAEKPIARNYRMKEAFERAYLGQFLCKTNERVASFSGCCYVQSCR